MVAKNATKVVEQLATITTPGASRVIYFKKEMTKMSYCNRVLRLEARSDVFGIRFWMHQIMRQVKKGLAWLRWQLWRHGVSVPFSLADATDAELLKNPEQHWDVSGLASPAEVIDHQILPWLDDTVLRAPNPMGIDFAAIILWVWVGDDDEPSANHRRLVDKYGWRKEGREQLREWLLQTLPSLGAPPAEIGAEVFNPGRLVAFCNRPRE